MAPHSNTLAWKISWMEEPGRLQSMRLLRVGHDWATSFSLFTFLHWRRKWLPTPVFLLENPRDGGAWWASVYGVAQSQTRLERLNSRHRTTHKCRSMPILSVNGIPFNFFVNLKQSEETIHRFLIPYFLNFQHQRYISPYFLLSKMNSPWIFISSNHSVALNPPHFSILSKDIASHNIPLSLFYIKISLFTGSFLLPFKHSLISSIKNRERKPLYHIYLNELSL